MIFKTIWIIPVYEKEFKIRLSSSALSDTRVFGLPFLENMTLRIYFIVELFLSWTRITSG